MPEEPARYGTVLAFDFGLKRIGIAVGQGCTATANPLETLTNTGVSALERIDRLIHEWRPQGLVVGLPLAADGGETEMSRSARTFAGQLQERSGIPVHFQDERLTSQSAAAEFARQRSTGERRRKDRRLTDAMAAKIILENWLQSPQ